MAKIPKIRPVSDLKQKTGDVFKELSSGEPVFITQRGRATAVMIDIKAYEQAQHELDILRFLARGEKEIQAGAGYNLEDILEEGDSLLKSINP